MKNKEHLLFVCTSNLDRSPCAESLFKNNRNYEAKSCGFYPDEQGIVISEDLVNWADVFFVMDERNEEHKTNLLKKFPDLEKEIIILDVQNDYCRNDPELERLLKIKLEDWLE